MGRCIYACNNEEACEDQCVDQFKTRQFDCPCEVHGLFDYHFLIIFQENCPGGCPCDDSPCAETTTAPDVTTPTAPATTTSPATNAVLVLSTKNTENKPMVIDWDGELISQNGEMNLNFHIQVTTMMTSILNMVLVQLFIKDVERP